MSGTTTNEGYPYPLTTDFADVQDAYRLALAIDSGIRAEQAPVRQFLAPPSFMVRSTSNSSTFTGGDINLTIGAVDWDNTGGAVIGATSWTQPYSQAPSWWLLGAFILVAGSSFTVGDMNMAFINAVTTDQVTGVSSTTSFYQRNDDSGTGGEWMSVFGMAQIYHGKVSAGLSLNGSTSKGITSGSRLWGMYLGPVNS